MDDIWGNDRSVYLTSFWGWTPDTWGTVGFTKRGRRDTIVRQTTDPFIMVIYVTKGGPDIDSDIRGKITGFYLVSHVEGHRDEFTHVIHHGRSPGKWQYSLEAQRAFSFLPEYRLSIDEFDRTLGPRSRAVAAFAEVLSEAQIDRLKAIPYVEVPVFGGAESLVGEIQVPAKGSAKVRAGPVNRNGYSVPGEPTDTEKELYTLVLTGDTSAFLGIRTQDIHIFKIGLSLSPKTRLECFRKMLPQGAFRWDLLCSTRNDGDAPYPSFEAAEAGESAMKDYLSQLKHAHWLGGEFYAVTMAGMENAWKIGREVALAYRESEQVTNDKP